MAEEKKTLNAGVSVADDRFSRELSSLIDSQIEDQCLSIEALCERLAMSRSTLYRKITNSTGLSPNDYIRQCKLNFAATRLKDNSCNVAEAAYAAGFNNLSYFSRCFKDKFGQLPLEYAKNNLSKKLISLPATSFIGRQKELDDLKFLLAERRLVNLTGPGGSGKTRLALEVAKKVQHLYRDGVVVVALAPVTDHRLVASSIAQSLSIIENPLKPVIQSVIDHIWEKRLLLILDNLEHLTAAAPVIKDLLEYCPFLHVLATSRMVLHLSAEQEFPVLPLSTPGMEVTEPEQLKGFSAIDLFLQRASSSKPGFRLHEGNASDIAQICRLLDGLPLALELAAPKVKIFSPGELLLQLRKSLSILSSDATDRPERHQTLLGALSWSYKLLDEESKTLFRRLSIFAGGFLMEDAGKVLEGHDPRVGVREGVVALLNNSFLESYEEKDGSMRFRMLETLRVFGLTLLEESGEEKSLRRSHAAYFLALAETSAPHLTGPDQKHWADRLMAEINNLRAALTFYWKQRDVECGLRLAVALSRFWNMKSIMKEGSEWLSQVISLSDNFDAEEIQSLKGRALSAYGIYFSESSFEFTKSIDVLVRGLEIFRKLDNSTFLATNLNHYGWMLGHVGKYEEARLATEEAKQINEKLNDVRGISVSLNNMGWLCYAQGELTKGYALYTESISLREKTGDKRGVAYVMTNLARIQRAMGDFNEALNNLDKATASLHELEDWQLLGWAGTNKAHVYYDLGDFNEALEACNFAKEGWQFTGNQFGLALNMNLAGLSWLALGFPEKSKTCLEDAHSIWTKMSMKWGLSFADNCMAEYEILYGDRRKAFARLRDALEHRVRMDEKTGICESLDTASFLLFSEGRYQEALIFISADAVMRDRIRSPFSPRFQPMRDQISAKAGEAFEPARQEEIMEAGCHAPLENLLSIIRKG